MKNRANRKNEQNLQIVKDLEVMNSNQASAKYGVTRQRIDTIYKEVTGRPYSELVKEKRQARTQAKKALLKKVRYKRDVRKQGRNPDVELICDNCKTPYHPFRNYKYADSSHHFCTVGCYFEYRVKHAKLPVAN